MLFIILIVFFVRQVFCEVVSSVINLPEAYAQNHQTSYEA